MELCVSIILEDVCYLIIFQEEMPIGEDVRNLVDGIMIFLKKING